MTERYYEDGTEPTVLPHLSQQVQPMQCCRGVGCQQGRLPCPHPEQCSEKSTDLERFIVGLVVCVSVAAVLGFVVGVLT